MPQAARPPAARSPKHGANVRPTRAALAAARPAQQGAAASASPRRRLAPGRCRPAASGGGPPFFGLLAGHGGHAGAALLERLDQVVISGVAAWGLQAAGGRLHARPAGAAPAAGGVEGARRRRQRTHNSLWASMAASCFWPPYAWAALAAASAGTEAARPISRPLLLLLAPSLWPRHTTRCELRLAQRGAIVARMLRGRAESGARWVGPGSAGGVRTGRGWLWGGRLKGGWLPLGAWTDRAFVKWIGWSGLGGRRAACLPSGPARRAAAAAMATKRGARRGGAPSLDARPTQHNHRRSPRWTRESPPCRPLPPQPTAWPARHPNS